MKVRKRTSAGLLLMALAATFFASAMMKRPSLGGEHTPMIAVNRIAPSAMVKRSGGGEEHTCHQAWEAQDPGQKPGQPGQEEEGNPSHKRPEHSCSHKPGKQQVGCHCQVDCNSDGTEKEDTRCRSYCYKDMCTCPRRPCA
jgi:hypothetical protein